MPTQDILAPNEVSNVVPIPTPIPGTGPPGTVTQGGTDLDTSTLSTFHTDYEVTNSYFKDRHVYMGGVTSPTGFQGNSVAFVQLAAPTLVWVCEWTACRADGPPQIPDPTPTDPNWILLDDQFAPFMVGVLDDGETSLQRISGRYVYGHVNPNATTTLNVTYPCPPWLDPADFDVTVPAESLANDISSPSGSSTLTTAPGVPVITN